MKTKNIPDLFWQRLKDIIPSELFEDVQRSFSLQRLSGLRVNTLKAEPEIIKEQLRSQTISFVSLPWSATALLVANDARENKEFQRLLADGQIYFQGLSSMLPVLALDPKPGERVLDLCAAPGSKTTQIAALMQNDGSIIAVEAIRNRFYRLKSVVTLLGAQNIRYQVMDGRRFRSPEPFDKILVDAPCSSEGRFSAADPDSFAYWSPRKIKEMVRKQRGLLLQATRLLKPGGVLVYSTCTFAPEENEGVVDWVLRKSAVPLAVESVAFEGVSSYRPVLAWGEKVFDPRVGHCCRVLPDAQMEGFFMAKLTSR